MKGDKNCVWCGAWLGNYLTGETPTGNASYYSIIRRKYCPDCYPYHRAQEVRLNMHEYRIRKKKLEKERENRLIALTEENKALKAYIIELREGVQHD